jgi:hypothetical protein
MQVPVSNPKIPERAETLLDACTLQTSESLEVPTNLSSVYGIYTTIHRKAPSQVARPSYPLNADKALFMGLAIPMQGYIRP